ncbi:hypothetical protein M0638_28500, partial [Roseomonas sp. NAR14]
MNAITRRGLVPLAGALALPVGGAVTTPAAAAATAGPDAALLALCADLQVAVAECNAASHLCDVMLEAGDDAG